MHRPDQHHALQRGPRRTPGEGHQPSRRRVLGLVAGAAGVLLGPAAGGTVATGEPLREPPVLRSRDGLLDVTLRAAPTTATVGGATWHVLGYEGGFPGPTLLVHPGDRMRVRLVNDLGATTNIHTHGLHVSGEGDGDNVFRHVEPGTEAAYRIDLRPDHHPGTNWYHPHSHGDGARQLFAGLAGALVVQSPREAALARRGLRDRVLLLHSTQVSPDGHVLDPLQVRQDGHVRLVNGQLQPTIDIRPGETQRWRLVNTTVNDVLRLQMPGLDLRQVAADGSPYRRPVPVTEVRLAAGQRADLLVTATEAGTTELLTAAFDVGFGVVLPAARLATVRCEGRAVARGRVPVAALLQPWHDLRGERVDRRRHVTMTLFGMDGRPFDHDRVDQVVALDSLEEWTVHNPTGLVHPFHIHVNPFQVTHVDGVPVDSPSYEDTVLVGKEGGSVTFLTRFRHFTGRAMYHCHFSTHSDLGMMAVAHIQGPDDPPLPEPDPGGGHHH